MELTQYIQDAREVLGIDISDASGFEEARAKVRSCEKKPKRPTRESPLVLPSTINEEARSVDATIATETPVTRYDWRSDEFYDEVLLVDGCRLDEVPQGEIPLLNSHNWEDIRAQIGSTTNLRIEDGVLVGTRVFSSTEEKIFTMVKEGHLKHQSIGYEVREVAKVSPGESFSWNGRSLSVPKDARRASWFVTNWLPFEDSIVSVPADRNCGIRSLNKNEEISVSAEAPKEEQTEDNSNNNPIQEERTMDNENTNPTPVVDETAIRSAAVKAASERCAVICNLCDQHQISAEKRSAFLTSDKDINAVKGEILDEVASRQAAMPAITCTADASDKLIEVASDGLLMREGIISKGVEGANNFRSISLKDMAAAILENRGQSVSRNIAPEELFQRAMATGDFPKLLANVAQRSLMQGFEETPTTYQFWCDLTGRVNDFREQNVARPVGNLQLDEVREGEEYTYASMSEDSDTVKVMKFGKKSAFTFEAWKNDDLGLCTTTQRELGSASRRLRDELAYNILIDNPNMRDGKALFHADHGNLASVSAKPTEASIQEAVTAMSTATDVDGKMCYVDPKTIIIPVSLQAIVAKLLHSVTFNDNNAAATQINTVYNRLNIVASARLDAAYKATVAGGGYWPWFVVGAPKYAVKFFFMNGYETPTISTKEGWDIDGFEIKCRDIVAAKAMTWQGMYKNAGGAL